MRPNLREVYFIVVDDHMDYFGIALYYSNKEYDFRFVIPRNVTCLCIALRDDEMQYSWLETLAEFPGMLPITPDNAEDKLKIILTFL